MRSNKSAAGRAADELEAALQSDEPGDDTTTRRRVNRTAVVDKSTACVLQRTSVMQMAASHPGDAMLALTFTMQMDLSLTAQVSSKQSSVAFSLTPR
jgi:hypothetical protein